jgi:type IV pilus assembly protein PilM
MGLFGSSHVVGIDLGHASIKVVGLATGKNPRVTGCTEVMVNPSALQKDGLEDPTAAEALKEALRSAQPKSIKTKEAYISIAESQVFRKILEVPRDLEGDELEQVLRSTVVEYLPDDISLLEIDYQPLTIQKESDVRPVMVVAVSKKAIEQYLVVAKKVGLHVHAIDPKPSALARALISPRKTEPIVIVDIGSEMTSISLSANQTVWVAGTVNVGGNLLKDDATGEIDEDRKEEKIKWLASTISDELGHVIKFYANRAPGGSVQPEEVRVTGGGSLIDGVEKAISEQAGISAVLGKPVVPVPENFDRRFMGALGSALYPVYETL